jgi:hypothetical protein
MIQCLKALLLSSLISATFSTSICISPLTPTTSPLKQKSLTTTTTRFKDVTLQSGVLGKLPQSLVRTSPACLFDQFDTTRRIWQRGSACAPEIMTGGAAVGDVDGDGRDDIYLSRMDGADSLFLNQGNGTFFDASGISNVVQLTHNIKSNGIALFDIDNDGDIDIFISTLGDTRMYLLVNNGIGVFTEEAISRGVALLRDIGRPPGEGGLTSSFSIAIGDYDGDGWLDLYTTEWFPRLHVPEELFSDTGIHRVTTCRLLHNLGASGKPGNFEDTTWSAGIRPRAGGATTQEEEMSEERWFSDEHQRKMFDILTNGRTKSKSSVSIANARSRIEAANVEARAHFSQMDARAEAMHKLYRRLEQEDNGAHSISIGGVSRKGRFPAHYFEGFPYRGIFQFGARFADLDGDGAQDLLISGDFGTSQLYWNNGNGTFSRGFLHLFHDHFDNSMGATIGDVDGDGRLDILFTSMFLKAPARMVSDRFFPRAGIASNFEGNHLYRNDGNRLFTDITATAGIKDTGWAWGGVLFDYDNDGRLDFAVCNGMDDPETTDDDFAVNTPNAAFRGLPPTVSSQKEGSKVTFAPVASQLGLDDRRDGRGYLEFDYDNDGDQDLFLVNHADYPVLYRNEGGNTNAWLRVRALESNCTNINCAWPRSSLGAKVYLQIRPNEKESVREIGSAAAYMAQSELTAHFGLGVSAPAHLHSVRIEWPLWGNASKTLYNVPIRTELVIRAPETRGEHWSAMLEGSVGMWTLKVLYDNSSSSSTTLPLSECVFEMPKIQHSVINNISSSTPINNNKEEDIDNTLIHLAPAAVQPLAIYPPVLTQKQVQERAEVTKFLNKAIGEFNWSASLAEIEAQWPLDLSVPRGSDSGRDTEVPQRLEWTDAEVTHRVLGATPPAPNNLAFPTLGARGSLFKRLVKRTAEDHFEQGETRTIKKISTSTNTNTNGVENLELPSARLISNRIMSAAALGLAGSPLASLGNSSMSLVNGLFTAFLGFVVHDLAGDLLPTDALRRSSDTGECCNIAVPTGDPQWDPEATGRKEIPFRRALFVSVPLTTISKDGKNDEITSTTSTTTSTTTTTTTTSLLRSREYVNVASSFLDLHHVYGTDDTLRAGRLVHHPFLYNNKSNADTAGAFLLEHFNDNNDNNNNESFLLQSALLPKNAAKGGLLETFEPLPNLNPRGLLPSSFFVAGDVRVNELPGLLLWHTLFAREHCRLVQAMKIKSSTILSVYPQLVYSTAASQLRSIYQAAVWYELLPILIGPDRFNSIPLYSGYNSSIDPTVTLEASAVLNIIYHTMLTDTLSRSGGKVFLQNSTINKNKTTTTTTTSLLVQKTISKTLSLTDSWYTIASRSAPNGYGLDSLLYGQLHQRAAAVDTIFAEGARNGFLGKDKGPGLDLGALDIMRSRDIGLASFGTIRSSLGLSSIQSFEHLISGIYIKEEEEVGKEGVKRPNISPMRQRLIERLEELYGQGDVNVARSDLLVSGLCELPLLGGLVGETFGAILTEQFIRLRDGDRFWYEAKTPSVIAALLLNSYNNESQTNRNSVDTNDVDVDVDVDKDVVKQAQLIVEELKKKGNSGHGGGLAGLLARVTHLSTEEIESLEGLALHVPKGEKSIVREHEEGRKGKEEGEL